MGLPPPAQDYAEKRMSFDKRIITRSSSAYLMRAGATHHCEGGLSGVVLEVDISLSVRRIIVGTKHGR